MRQQEKHWSVEIRRDGESILVIESNCMAGKDPLTDEELRVIRKAARQLLAFAGSDEQQP